MTRTATAVCVAVLIAAVVVLYWPAIGFDFISLDDPAYVFDNPPVRDGLSWAHVRWAFTTFHASNWHPLTWLSLMLDATVFGSGPSGFHGVNVALHALNAALLFLALRSLRAEAWPAFFVAALFAVHPLRVESVAWITERKDVLSGLFWMLTLLAYGWYARRPAARRYAAVCAALALGLLAKPMLVTLPFVLLLLDVWPLARWRALGGAESSETLLLEKLPLFAIVVAAIVVTTLAQQSQGAVASLDTVPLSLRVANAMASYGSYLSKSVRPVGLAINYPHPAFLGADAAARTLHTAWLVAPLLVAASALALALLRRAPYVAVGWFWYLGTLVPVIGLVQAGQQAMADRYAYVPLIGMYIVLAWAARDLLRWRPSLRPLAVGATGLILVACVWTTRRQLEVWRDGVSVFTHAVEVVPDSYFAHTNLAAVLMQLGRVDAAQAHYQAALAVYPTYPTALTGMGSLRFDQGDFAAAVDYHRRALVEEPASPVVLANLGGALMRLGDFTAATDALERAVALAPDYAMARANLGALYVQQNRPADAATQLERAIALGPDTAGRRTTLGIAYANAGRWSDAATQFEVALRLQPGEPTAQRFLAVSRARIGK